MEELGKFILAITLIASGLIIILFFGWIIPAGSASGFTISSFQILLIILGAIISGFGGLLLYFRKVSINVSSRSKKIKSVKVKKIKKTKKPAITLQSSSTTSSTKTSEQISPPEEEDIICLTCEFYDKYNPKQKCKYLSEKDRLEMLKSGVKCVEYQLHHSLINEI
ncbi:MAG: hypothetical protein ACTSYZ_12125 [Candidatus Helarchaeota archaeon]